MVSSKADNLVVTTRFGSRCAGVAFRADSKSTTSVYLGINCLRKFKSGTECIVCDVTSTRCLNCIAQKDDTRKEGVALLLLRGFLGLISKITVRIE